MHKLTRGKAPACLKKYDWKKDDWGTVISAKTVAAEQNRWEIWHELTQIQGNRCAYCESDLGDKQCHIEHFRQRKALKGRPAYREGTFEWDNLFGSCNSESHCGDYKDENCFDYDHRDLIKPDIDDPDDYFVFVADGSIHPRDDLDGDSLRKAEETIRVFNLDHDAERSAGSLRFRRWQAIAGYVQTGEYLAEIAELYTEEEWLPLLQEEIDRTADLPYATAIRHVLRFET